VIDVLGFEERDRSIGHRKIHQGEKAGALLNVKVVSDRRRLRDFVPVILDLATPERSNHGLLGSTRRAIDLAYASHFSKILNVFLVSQSGRWIRKEFARIDDRKGSYIAPLSEVSRCKVWRSWPIKSRNILGFEWWRCNA
jgi:hypothetical protein